MPRKIKKILYIFRNFWVRTKLLKHWEKIFANRNKELGGNPRVITKNEIDQINCYYKNFGLKPSSVFHEFYKRATGKFDVRLIPDNIYYSYIDPYFNDWTLAQYIDNKTFYHLLFPNVKQPLLLAYRQNGFWYNNQSELISEEKVYSLMRNEEICFLKQANDSEGGNNIYVITSASHTKHVTESIRAIKNDIVIQKGLQQSPILSLLNPSSVNTIRIITLLRKDGSVKVCSTSLRMGINGARVDNASSGGVTVGVKSDGSLNSTAYAANGKSYEFHPTSKVNFSDIKIPNYSDVVCLVQQEAKKKPHFRLISWDIALDENNTPVLIEANFKYGELEFHQLNNGPIFGNETDEILSEVFGKNGR